jgi:antitoxin (DNA-binding transcriptional repressor) of toxin-antitoxin stability system
MKTATVRHLRNNFSQIAKWLKDGEQVVITMRNKVIARIIPEPSGDRTLKMPDFAARIREEYPHRRISEKESAALRREFRGDR